MTIHVRCKCGARFEVRDEYGGKKGQCPTCGNLVLIPKPGEDVYDDDDLEVVDEDGDDDFMEFDEAKPKRKKGGIKGNFSQLFSLNRSSGLMLMLSGLLLVILSRGCDSTANRSIARSNARFDLVKNEFEDQWDEQRIPLLKQQSGYRKQILEINNKQEELREESRNPATRKDGFDYDAELKILQDKIDGIQKLAGETDKELQKLTNEKTDAETDLLAGEWRSYKIDLRDAIAANTSNRWWREWFFVIGTMVLAVGLITLATYGEPAERMVCMIMIAILTFSIYIGGTAWIDTIYNNMESLEQSRSKARILERELRVPE